MPSRSPEIDAYIDNAAPFAQPILRAIREAFHEASDDIVETTKWSMPHFDYKGIMAGMAAFKAHAVVGFWKAKLLRDGGKFPKYAHLFDERAKLTDVSQLPPKKDFVAIIREAMRLNDEGVKVEKPKKEPKAAIEEPAEFTAALKKNATAKKTWSEFAPSHKREYLQWIVEAKQEATRQKRIAQAIEWISEGKQRNWKYMK